MSVQHTPGPWMVSASGHTVYALHGEPPRNHFSALVQSGRADDAPDAELAANARLMATAPTMLEALVEAAGALQGAAECMRKVDAPKTADKLEGVALAALLVIAKATGVAA